MTWIIVVGFIAAGLAAIVLRRDDTPPSAPADAAVASTDATAPERAAAPAAASRAASLPADAAARPRAASTTAPTVDALPLPPLDAPLAGILDDLERRARAGDARAACRLASDLSRCGSLPRRRAMERSLAQQQFQPPPERADEMVETIARHGIALEVDERLCAGVKQDRTKQATAWLLAAARGGNLPSMAAFVTGQWIYDPGVVRHAPAVDAYQREAPAMARQLVEAGNARALPILAQAYAGEEASLTPLAEVIEPDPVLGRALLGLVVEAQPLSTPAPVKGVPARPNPIGERLRQLDERLTPEQRDAARAMQQRLRPKFDADRATAAQSRIPRMGTVHFLNPADCDR